MKQYTLSVLLELKNRLSGPLLDAKKQIEQVQNSTKGLTDAFNVLANQQAAQLGSSLVSSFAAPVKVAAAFESELAALKSVSGATAAEMALLSAGAKEAGIAFGFRPTETIQGMQELASAGQDAATILKTIQPTLLLAKAGSLSMGQAAAITSGTLASFGLQAEKTQQVVDILAAAGNYSKLSISDMAPALAAAGAAASASNQSLTETVSVIAAMRDRNMSAAEAGTAFRSSITALTAPSDEARKLIQMLGIQTRDASGKMLPITTVFENIQRGLSGLPAAQADVFKAKILGGSEGLRVFNTVVSAGIGNVREMRDKLGQASGVAKEFADNNAATLNGAMAEMSASAEQLKIQIGEGLLPPLAALTRQTVELLKPVMALVKEYPVLTSHVLGGGIAFGGTLLILSKVPAIIGSIVTAFNGLRTVMIGIKVLSMSSYASLAALTKGFIGLAPAIWAAAAPVLPFIAAAGALAWAGYVVWKNWAQIRGEFRLLFQWFAEAGPKLIDTFIGGLLGGVGALKDAAGKVFGALREFLPFSDAKVGPLSDLSLSGMRFAETFAGGIEGGEGILSMKVEKTLKGAAPGASGGRPVPAGTAPASRGGIVLNSPVFNLSGGSAKEHATEFLAILDRLSRGLA